MRHQDRKRSIIHLDMDAFYASVEQADDEDLKGRPVIVGGSTRGVVCAASYEARRSGVHSAMPMFQALKRCPQAVVLPVRMGRYKEISRQIMEILLKISPLVEQVSIDEAFVDITGTEKLHGPPEVLARKLKDTIRHTTQLTCSIGIAPNKLLAKIASDINKPDGLTVIEAVHVESFMKTLPISKIPGIGKRTIDALSQLGITMAGEVSRFPPAFWAKRFGKAGLQFYERAQGIDHSVVVPERQAKSFGAENTFPEDTADIAVLKAWLMVQCQRVGRELRKRGYCGKTITLKIKYSDFKTISRSRSLVDATDSTAVIYEVASELLCKLFTRKKMRLIGVSVSGLSYGVQQLRIFTDEKVKKWARLDRALDRIHERYGKDLLMHGRIFEKVAHRTKEKHNDSRKP